MEAYKKPSIIIFTVAGLMLLASAPFIVGAGLVPWIIAKLLYGLGVIFFLFNK